MTRIIHPPFREQFEQTKYPFADNCSLISDTGYEIGMDTFLDAKLYPIGGGERLFITSILTENEQITITIGNEADLELASTTFNGLSPPDILYVVDRLDRPAGVLVSESIRLARFQVWETGTHRFSLRDTEFCASCCIPMPQIGLRGILLENEELFTEDVWLIGENGVVVREDPDETVEGGRVIRIDIVGDPLFRRALCDKEANGIPLFRTPAFVRTINNLTPNDLGEFSITVGSNVASAPILRIVPTPSGLKIEAVGQKAGDI